MKKMARYHQALQFLVLGTLAMMLVTFMFRSPIASWYLQRKIQRFNQAYNAKLSVDRVRIHGLASVLVTGISLTPDNGDTLLKADTAFASIGILKLFAARVAIHDVHLINTEINIVARNSVSNFSFLLHRGKERSDTTRSPVNYAANTDRMMRFIFDKIPLALNIRNFKLTSSTNGHQVRVYLDRLVLDNQYFRTAVEVSEDSASASWTVAGRIDNNARRAEFRIYPADTSRLVIPFIRHRLNAGVDFDTVAFSISGQDPGEEVVTISGFVTLSGLRVDHRRIAAVPVQFEKLGVRYQLNIGADYAELDSTTQVVFNRVDFNPYLRYRPKPVKQVTLRIHKPQFPAQDLFSSFPEGLFTNLDGIRVKGNLSWYLDFFVDLSIPDSLRFSTALNKHGFSVLSYGNSDLQRISGSFAHTAYQGDVPVRTFILGPENPEFRSLDHISGYLQNAVLTSEDGGFFQHRGFLPDAFRESIITNIKERRFARGGSTISMQLVKNVFLNRNKTVARKVEEALIVWLIENQGLSTKERMFEVYLNLIEWGPGVYGANEASHYYFNKEASKLTLAEAIFMASIIPRPKGFRYSFDENGHLREFLDGYYRLVSEKMLGKGWITPGEAEGLVPDVELKGPARLLLKQQ